VQYAAALLLVSIPLLVAVALIVRLAPHLRSRVESPDFDTSDSQRLLSNWEPKEGWPFPTVRR